MTLTELRTERNARLAACDFYFLADVAETLNENVKAAFILYRQALRDLPSAYTEGETIEEVEWPAEPFTTQEA
mgnify:CR=1 FL=1|tara:strand:- start:108 stop:326 length:219 start_codon:yes stop_codon:yes gene_type:complete